MIIEFVGVSGAGKTTCIRKYCNNPRNKHVIVVDQNIDSNQNWFIRNIIKFFFCLPFIATNLSWIIKFKCFIWELDFESKDRIVLLYHGIYLKKQLMECNDSNKDYVIDEGSVHYIWSVFMRLNQSIDKYLLEKLVEEIDLPDQIYYIDAQTDIIMNRLINRGRRTRILEFSDLKKEIQINRERLTDIIQVINEKKLVDKNSIIYIDNSLPF